MAAFSDKGIYGSCTHVADILVIDLVLFSVLLLLSG